MGATKCFTTSKCVKEHLFMNSPNRNEGVIMKDILKFVSYAILVLTIGAVAQNTGLIDRLLGRYTEEVTPPIRIEFRESAQFWKQPKEYVMRITNMDAQKGLEFEILQDGKSERQYRHYLKPGETGKEFGEIQIGNNFVEGDSGQILVEGYGLVLRYNLTSISSNGEFRVQLQKKNEK